MAGRVRKMTDTYGRNINYMRISVTDRCNLRCRYCMPEEGLRLGGKGHNNILTLEECARLVQIAAGIGIHKIRLTGGEPLVRRNLVKLIGDIASIAAIDDIAITTNGMLFAPMAAGLQSAGLQRVNFSVDTLEKTKYRYITRQGDIGKLMASLYKALELEMHPVKINMVVIRGFNDDEIMDFVRLAYNYPLHVRFIEFMPVGDLLYWRQDRSLCSREIKAQVQQEYALMPVRAIRGNGPAKYYKLEGGQGSVGFISPLSNHFCGDCNRIRLTAEGKLRACLYDPREIDLKTALQNQASDSELKDLFLSAISLKPEKHSMHSGWGAGNKRKMHQIGG